MFGRWEVIRSFGVEVGYFIFSMDYFGRSVEELLGVGVEVRSFERRLL